MARVLVMADMEGVSGIETGEQCDPNHPDYAQGRQLLADEVNVLAGAAYEAGARSVSVIDWHAGGGNLQKEMLAPGVEIVPEDLTVGYDVAFLTGFHAMAGAQPGFLTHTMTGGLALELAGRPAGELALLSQWAGDHGIPVALITGDRAATLEGEQFLFETPTLTVKQARSWARADALPVERAHEVLRSEVLRVMDRPDRWRAYQPEVPVQFRVRLRWAEDLAARIPWLVREVDGGLRGELPSIKALIDLIDVLAALIAAERRGDLLRRLAQDPDASGAVERERLADLQQRVEENPWP